MVAQRLVAVPWQRKHGAALAAHTRRLVLGLAETDFLLSAEKGVDERNRLKEVSVLHPAQHFLSGHRRLDPGHVSLRTAVPVVAEAKVFGRVGCRQELKGVEDYAASIHLFKNMADGFLLNSLF